MEVFVSLYNFIVSFFKSGRRFITFQMNFCPVVFTQEEIESGVFQVFHFNSVLQVDDDIQLFLFQGMTFDNFCVIILGPIFPFFVFLVESKYGRSCFAFIFPTENIFFATTFCIIDGSRFEIINLQAEVIGKCSSQCI